MAQSQRAILLALLEQRGALFRTRSRPAYICRMTTSSRGWRSSWQADT